MILGASFSIEQYPFQFSARIKKIGDNGANRALHAGLRMDPWHLRDRQKRSTVVKDLCVVLMVAFNCFVIGTVQFGKPSRFGVVPGSIEKFNEHTAIFGWQLGAGIWWMKLRELTLPQGCFVSFFLKHLI